VLCLHDVALGSDYVGEFGLSSDPPSELRIVVIVENVTNKA